MSLSNTGQERSNLMDVGERRGAKGSICQYTAERRRMLNMHTTRSLHGTCPAWPGLPAPDGRRLPVPAPVRRGGRWIRVIELCLIPASYSNTFSVDTLLQLMAIQDRTNEFRTCVDSIRNRSALPSRTAEAKQRLLQRHAKGTPKTEFSRMASVIGKDISSTTIKLGKLAHRKLSSGSFRHSVHRSCF